MKESHTDGKQSPVQCASGHFRRGRVGLCVIWIRVLGLGVRNLGFQGKVCLKHG